MKNTLAGIIISLLLISFIGGLTRPVQATVPTIDLEAIGKLISQLTELKNIFGATNKTAGNTLGTLQQMILEWTFKLNNERLKKQLLDQLANQITQWVLGKGGSGNCTVPGFAGPVVVPCNQMNQPKFVTNWKQYAADASLQGANTFMSDFGGVTFCPSSGGGDTGSVIKALVRQSFTADVKTAYSCSVPNDQIAVFAPGGGGWEGWLKLNEPGNDFNSKFLLLEEQAGLSAHAEQQAKLNEALSGNGYIGEKKCKNETTKIVDNPDGTSVTSFVCLDDEITTPAGTVSALANTAATKDFNYIPNAEDLSSFVSTLANSIFNLIQSLGLKNVPSGSIGSSGPVLPPGGGGGSAAEQQCAALKSNPAAYQDCITAVQSGQTIRDFQKKFLFDQIREEINARQQIIMAKTGTLNTLTQAADALNQLKTTQKNIDNNAKLAQYLKANPGTKTFFFNQATLDQVISQKNQPTSVIAQLQQEIIDWTARQSRVLAAQTQQKIARLSLEISPLFKTAGYKNEMDDSKNELAIRQQELIGYNQLLQNAQNLLGAINNFALPEEGQGISPPR